MAEQAMLRKRGQGIHQKLKLDKKKNGKDPKCHSAKFKDLECHSL
jgi:hypothetical protein